MDSDSVFLDRLLHSAGLKILVTGLLLSAAPAHAREAVLPILTDQSQTPFDLAEMDAERTEAQQMLALQDPLSVAPDAEARLPDQPVSEDVRQRVSYGRQLGSIKWEIGGALLWLTASNIYKAHNSGLRGFHFQHEGWFGDDTFNLGIDKLAHAWNSYWITDAAAARIRYKSGASNPEFPAFTVSMGLMIYSELWDAHKKNGGFATNDVIMNTAGAAFSVVRNRVPGLKEKLDFRQFVMPNSDVYTPTGVKHFRQLRYLMALKLSGFEGMELSPLRFVELHAGYRATGFSRPERARGEPLRQRPFVGVGINLNALFFRNPEGWAGKAASTALQYIQVPYTAYHVELR